MRLISSNNAAKLRRDGKPYYLRSISAETDLLANSAIPSLPIPVEFRQYEDANRCLIGV